MPGQRNSPALPSQNFRHLKQTCLTSSSEADPFRQYINGPFPLDNRDYDCSARILGGPVPFGNRGVQSSCFPPAAFPTFFQQIKRPLSLIDLFKQTTMPWQQHSAGTAWQRPGAKFSYISA